MYHPCIKRLFTIGVFIFATAISLLAFGVYAQDQVGSSGGGIYSISIESPMAKQNIWTGSGNIIVKIKVTPPLDTAADITVRIFLDGKPSRQTAGTSMSVELKNIYRGSHTLLAQAVDSKGNVLASSERITIYVHRPSVLNRGNFEHEHGY